MDLTLLEEWWKSYQGILGLLGTVSGWATFALSKWSQRRIQVTVETEGSDIYLLNHGERTLELIGCVVTVRDMFSKPELAVTRTSMFGLVGVIKQGERKRILGVMPIAEMVEEIEAPRMKALTQMYPTMVGHWLAAVELRLTCVQVGYSRSERTVTLKRDMVGYPLKGWHLTYSPYHHPRPVGVWLEDTARSVWVAVRHPGAAIERWKQFRRLGLVLQTEDVMRALSNKVIDEPQALARLSKLAPPERLEEAMQILLDRSQVVGSKLDPVHGLPPVGEDH